MTKMSVEQYVLAMLSTGGGQSFTPVQVQKFFFILDKEVPAGIGGAKFDFQPYDDGPFDKKVYGVLENLASREQVIRSGDSSRSYQVYSTSGMGQKEGERLFGQFKAEIQQYAKEVSEFVLECSFTELVSAIYKKYPEMKVNSVFQQT